jgi:hypothetical protein
VKLEPNMLDREAPYGTLAEGNPNDGFTSIPLTPYPETRAWAAGATLRIYPKDLPTSPVYDGTASAEVNATGRVVYGYNLRVQAAGSYVIEYAFPNVTITGVDAGTFDGGTATLEITVGGGGGGGGGKGRP